MNAGLQRRSAAPIDTLWLNPLAFPRNPYHHLVKHYQDGRDSEGGRGNVIWRKLSQGTLSVRQAQT